MFKVSKQFIKDFAFVANFYEWKPDEVEEFKSIIRGEGDGEMKRYIEKLSRALQSGYRQTKANGFIRLEKWLWMRGETLA